MSRPCPRCNNPLSECTLGGVTLDACPQCKGIWLDAGELLVTHAVLQRGGFFSLAPGEADPWGHGKG